MQRLKAPPAPTHKTHPWKVEAYGECRHAGRRPLVGRAMFKTREEADAWAEGLPVWRSKPGDTEFA